MLNRLLESVLDYIFFSFIKHFVKRLFLTVLTVFTHPTSTLLKLQTARQNTRPHIRHQPF